MKAKVFNAYTIFILGVLLVGGLTFVQLPCPACGGTGIVEGVRGLEVAGVTAELVSHKTLGVECGWDWERYTYNVKISVENKTTAQGYGVVMVNVSDPGEAFTLTQEVDDAEVQVQFGGKVLQSFPFYVEVPPGKSDIVEKQIVFEGITLQLFGEGEHRIDAATATEFTCPFGTKVSLPEWLKLKR